MKNKDTLILVLAVAALVVAVIALSQPKELVVSDTQQAQITVSGESERFVAPDTASVSFTLTRKDTNLNRARESVDDRIKNILRSLKSDGIEEKDIKTTNFSVRPEYNYTQRRQVFDGYRVNQTLELTIRDIDAASVVLGKIGALEVDNVSSLRFYVEDDEEIRDELREEAIDDAKDKARALARDLGVELVEIVDFSEGGGGKYFPEPHFRSLEFAESEDQALSSPASIPTGENEYSANVSITYRISK